jgi:hypothetical protein
MYLKTTSKSDEEETPHVQITEISIYAPYGLLLGHRCGYNPGLLTLVIY